MRLSEQLFEAVRQGLGPGGACRCPRCGHSEPHRTGKPCMDIVCPKCGAKMDRSDASV